MKAMAVNEECCCDTRLEREDLCDVMDDEELTVCLSYRISKLILEKYGIAEWLIDYCLSWLRFSSGVVSQNAMLILNVETKHDEFEIQFTVELYSCDIKLVEEYINLSIF